MAGRKKILLITGSMNQTMQMVKIAGMLQEYECWFSQIFSDSALLNLVRRHTSLLNKTIISDLYRRQSENYLLKLGHLIDYSAQLNRYDMVVCCSDMIVPARLRMAKTIWVQEGMIDKSNWLTKLVKRFRLHPALCFNTSLNGATNICDIYCAASEGYKAHISAMGTEAHKIYVTGIPNYDNLDLHRHNDFPYRDYVMVATTDMRETSRYENRRAFIKTCVAVANGRQLLFKLHPNENFERAVREIKKYAPSSALVFTGGNTNDMIANSCELITQYSTVVYTGIALGKKVHSWFNVQDLEMLVPVQNGGTSAKNIALLCKRFIEFEGNSLAFSKQTENRQAVAGYDHYLPMQTSYAG